jgi:hypothetical protein
MAMIMMTKKPSWTRADANDHIAPKIAPATGIDHRIAPMIRETMLKRNQMPPKMIDCMA